METKERRLLFLHHLDKETPLCVNCKYFMQHYIFSRDQRFEPLQMGHCIQGKRTKNTRAYDECEHFSNRFKG